MLQRTANSFFTDSFFFCMSTDSLAYLTTYPVSTMQNANIFKHYDLAVIGGGINGAAIARDASLRGLSAILLEQYDFGSGASANTSKLAHGGLRYLEHLQLHLVKESLYERNLLLTNAPHIVKPLPFVFPVYKGDRRPLWMAKLGLYMYDFLDRGALIPRHSNLNAQDLSALFPTIKPQGLKGGVLYFDAQMLDYRLVMENILAAQEAGATILNHTQVTGLSNPIQGAGSSEGAGPTQIAIESQMLGIKGSIWADAVVNASGAWSNQIFALEGSVVPYMVKPTKGVHVVLPQVHSSHALVLAAPQDSRICFLMPWEENTSLLGTTDTFYTGSPDRLCVEPHEIEYLLQTVQHYFPDLAFTKKSVIATFAGLRPLVQSKKQRPSDISREHFLAKSPAGMITLLGGKFTTHRKMAQVVVDAIFEKLKSTHEFVPCETKQSPLYGSKNTTYSHMSEAELKKISAAYALDLLHVRHLIDHYGGATQAILKIIADNPLEGLVICTQHPHLFAELTYAITVEKALTLEDWFCRRTSISRSRCRGVHCVNAVAKSFGQLLGWDAAAQQKAISDYLASIPFSSN